MFTFAPAFEAKRSVSSVGLERLLDRQEVNSSNLLQITLNRRSVSSVGLERFLHTEEVDSSNLPQTTTKRAAFPRLFLLYRPQLLHPCPYPRLGHVENQLNWLRKFLYQQVGVFLMLQVV